MCYLKGHQISQQHDMADINIHPMVDHCIYYLIDDGLSTVIKLN